MELVERPGTTASAGRWPAYDIVTGGSAATSALTWLSRTERICRFSQGTA